MNDIAIDGATLLGLAPVNLILGRNGSGKSRFLRAIDIGLAANVTFQVRYITPERAGTFQVSTDGDNIQANKQWLPNSRRKNQSSNFKNISAYLLRDVELAYLRRLERNATMREDSDRTFQADRIDKVNRLLLNLSIEQQGTGFVLRGYDGDEIKPDEISSGEGEALALAAEILHFFETLDQSKDNVLLVDEPDVHMHPDLQARLATLLLDEIEALDDGLRNKVSVCVATHSTPLICALAHSPYVSLGNKEFGHNVINLAPASVHLQKVAPFFGHPLSLALSNDTVLIMEGEDDERVWQQASRTSNGKIKLFPIVASTKNQLNPIEKMSSSLLSAIYDNPVGYSIRDGDGVRGCIDPEGVIQRFRLQCYEIENCLLTDDCLATMGTTWAEFVEAAAKWVADNQGRKEDATLVTSLLESRDRLRDTKIKTIRSVICNAICGSTKPWEVVIGKAIAEIDLTKSGTSSFSLREFIGEEAVATLLK